MIDLAVAALLALSGTLPPHPVDPAAAKAIAVLEGGRVRPLAAVAGEAMSQIHGREELDGTPPLSAYLMIAVRGQEMSEIPLVRISHRALRRELELPEEGSFASFRELSGNPRLGQILSRVREKRERGIRPSPSEDAAEELAARLERFSAVASGLELRWLPGPIGDRGEWRSPPEVPLAEAASSPFLARRMLATSQLLEGLADGRQAAFDSGARGLSGPEMLAPQARRLRNGSLLPASPLRLRAELLLRSLQPFRIAWILLLLSCLVLLPPLLARTAWKTAARLKGLAEAFAWCAAILVSIGFALRVAVSARAPVTNMYETTIWAGFGALIFGLLLHRLRKRTFLLATTCGLGVVLFVLADSFPTVLDPAIDPLVPVLRSNGWLVLHVLVVTLAYAAFLLASALGNLGLGQVFRRGDLDSHREELAYWSFRAMQMGVLLLTAGILLGGVWADHAWGRFWGWDPKETWSLIADLGYLAVLHGRHTGWIRVRGTLLGAVLAFYGVLMAWYGVNFLLASGLHSYGFSRGGTAAMAGFALVQAFWVVLCLRRDPRRPEADQKP
jgi:cytochrome c-type biogenesis protein CcsB